MIENRFQAIVLASVVYVYTARRQVCD